MPYPDLSVDFLRMIAVIDDYDAHISRDQDIQQRVVMRLGRTEVTQV